MAAEVLGRGAHHEILVLTYRPSFGPHYSVNSILGFNYLSTRSFGESEYVFSSIKVITVFVFLFCGFMLIFGIGGTSLDLRIDSRGSTIRRRLGIHPRYLHGGWFFLQGTELIGVAAGEAEDPEKNVPKAINSIFWRILLFYIGAFIVIGFLIPYTDPNLLNSSVENVSISPFTLVFDRFGFAFAASFINAIILTAVLSAGNSGLIPLRVCFTHSLRKVKHHKSCKTQQTRRSSSH